MSPPEFHEVTLGRRPLRIARWRREGVSDAAPDPLLYLHGLGSTHDDLLEFVGASGLPGRDLVALDFPGCGASSYPEGGGLSVEDLVEVVRGVLGSWRIRRLTLVGHSMGGLVGLLLARRCPGLVRRFVNVEGNLAPEDCGVFSRDVAGAARARTPEEILHDHAGRMSVSQKPGFAAFAGRLPAHVHPRAFVDYCRSIVEHSDGDPLLEWFLGLRVPRLFVHGDRNASLSYLGLLRRGGVEVASIPGSDHFPAYTNPGHLLATVARFLEATDGLALD